MTHAERAIRRSRIAEAIRSGTPIEQVIAEEKVTRHLIQSSCKERGIPVPTGRYIRSNPTTLEILALLLNTSLSIFEIAKQKGISHQRVSQIQQVARKAGIKVRERKNK